jgi:hypothetical protein
MYEILIDGSAITLALFSALKENYFHIIFTEIHTGEKY